MSVISRMIDHAYALAVADTTRLVHIQTHNLTRLQAIAAELPKRVFNASHAACCRRNQVRVGLLTLRDGHDVFDTFDLDTCMFQTNVHDPNTRHVFDPETISYYLERYTIPKAQALLRRYADLTPPTVDSVWQHYNKLTSYEIVCITNASSTDQMRYPTTVVYRGLDNGKMWSRPLWDWHRSMTQIR